MIEQQTKQRFVVRLFEGARPKRWGVYDTETNTFPLSRPGYGKVPTWNEFVSEKAAQGAANSLSAFYGLPEPY